MKISIPSMGCRGMNEIICDHFGMAESYTVIDTETEEVKIIPVTSEPPKTEITSPDMLFGEGVNVVLCGGLACRGIGLLALKKLEELGIEVYVGAIGTVRDALQSYQVKALERATYDNICCECNSEIKM
ncbi:MAG: NifB/NifX family molybdenum-iron cluster-binding protein [Halobacteriota archaeon]|nr:NifB/NifX family molybdenum-iron cluster-binding protein [Halobacteriota archaeon]